MPKVPKGIVIPKQNVAELEATQQFPFMHGFYHKDSWKISYFNMTMSPETAASVFNLASEIPENDKRQWKIEELFQRDIEWIRVGNEIVPYITTADKPTFFGALTIAVLPYRPDKNEVLSDFNSWDGWVAPEPDEEHFAKSMKVGPMLFSWFQDWNDIVDEQAMLGMVSWNKRQMYPVAIDGQHRLAAFKKIAKDPARLPALRKHRITVQFLVFDELVGFEKPDDEPQGDLRVMRDLFIDLNKYAKPVPRDRLILLEDGEPQAVCVRSVMSTQLEKDVSALSAETPTLPLSLIDWHSGKTKFDGGPYITTVLTLDTIVAAVIGKLPVSNYLDYDSVRREIKNLETQLDLNLEHAKNRVDANDHNGEFFVYDRDTVTQISNAFARTWAPQICKVFNTFKPYADFIEMRKANDSVALDYQHWVYLSSLKGQEHEDELSRWLVEQESRAGGKNAAQLEAVKDAIKEFKGNKNRRLAFLVVFQVALMKSWLRFIRFTVADLDQIENVSQDIGDLDEEEEVKLNDPADLTLTRFENISERTDQFVSVVNRIIENFVDFLNPGVAMPAGEADFRNGNFWAGAFLKIEDETIDFTAGAAARGQDMINVLVAMIVYDDQNNPDEESDFDEFWHSIHVDDPSPFIADIKKSLGRMVNPKSGGGQAARIINALELDTDDSADPEKFLEAARENEIKERLRFVWKKLKL